ncbi:MAG: hypothetical protein M1813_001755 [Trichoglossum hirsutum]|nr:MAG: hypothetical protein M1813_001755 [Trichoglossum hirsutum]
MADPSVQDTQNQQRQAALNETAAVSVLVRRALVDALPVAPEQYLTLSLPGIIVDINDIAQGGSYVYNVATNPFTPTAVRQAEAKLVDGMMPLGSIMIGNTGKSVTRSYASALDYLVPKKATVSTQNNIRSPGDKSYDGAMTYLTTKDPASGKTPVEVYIEKQTAWATAQDAWDSAKIKARRDAAAANPNDNAAAVQQYNDWSQSHYRRVGDSKRIPKPGGWTESAWGTNTTWSTTSVSLRSNGHGSKDLTREGLVDVDSIMARIESSKQSMRNSTIVDADGANELNEVNLNPKNWAFLCKAKVEGSFQGRPPYTLDQVNSEIFRLQEFEASLKALLAEAQKSPPAYPKSNPGPKPDVDTAQKELNDAYTALYDAQGKLNSEDTSINSATIDKLRSDLNAKINAWEDVSAALVKWELSQPGDNAKATIQKLIVNVGDQLGKLRNVATQLSGSSITAIVNAHSSTPQGDAKPNPNATSGNDMASGNADLARPIFGVAPPPGSSTAAPIPLDPWTKITFSFSATDQKTHMDQSSWGFSAGASVSFGWFSAGGSYSHDESSANFRDAMSNCSISVSFSAMVVNIDRPWLYAELFNDYEIDIARLSPGPELLHQWMDNQQKDPKSLSSLAMYNVFPSFPTSFIVACNTEVEFTGKTTYIEQHFRSVSNSASANVGWGPFSASASFHSQSSSSDLRVETTATGCKITFAAPQIIAWVSQILPALPRDLSFEPLLQRNVPA